MDDLDRELYELAAGRYPTVFYIDLPLVAQHTWTQACDGLHPPGPCPEPPRNSGSNLPGSR